MFYEQTIKAEATIQGVGLHRGQLATLRFLPAPIGTGIVFVRTDLPGSPCVAVNARRVSATLLATTLGHDDFFISTVEHCLAAIAALRIDNLYIELDSSEVPICDGSALPFYEALVNAQIYEQDAAKKYCYITRPIKIGREDKHIYILPYNGLKISYTIDFPDSIIGQQSYSIDVYPENFHTEIAPARTFGFYEQVEKLRKKGLALGGSLDNAVVIGKDGVMNPEGLRYPDEFVRHKILDAMGDLMTLGWPLMGHVVLYKAGHELMNLLIKDIQSSSHSYRLVELGGVGDELLAEYFYTDFKDLFEDNL